MGGWLLFALFLLVGLGLLIGGIVYWRKEKNDPESAKIYRVMSIIGAVLTAASILIKVL